MKKKKLILILMIVVAAIVVVCGGFLSYMFLMKKTVSFVVNGSEYLKVKIGATETTTFPKELSITNNGYTFSGWYIDPACKNEYREENLKREKFKKNIKIYAGFTPITYTIHYHLDEDVINTANPETFTIESPTIVLQDPVKENYTFMGWFVDELCSTEITEITHGSYNDINLYASFKANSEIFETSGSTITGLTAYGKTLTEIVIPNSIDGTQITKIGDSAFKNLYNLVNVDVGANITQISNNAFSGCERLETITISNNVTVIGNGAFSGCKRLQNIKLLEDATAKNKLPSSLTKIEASAFYNCAMLTDLTAPESLTEIGEQAFEGCLALKSIQATGLTLIGEKAFKGCVALESFVIPDAVTIINAETFSGCTNLTSLHLGANITNINNDAFKGCEKLLPMKIASINDWMDISFQNAFANPLYYAKQLYINDNLLTNLSIDKFTEVKPFAFINSTINSVVLGGEVATIGQSAFQNCSELTNLTIPGSVTEIGADAFKDCVKINTLNIDKFANWFKITFGNEFANPLLYAHKFYGESVTSENADGNVYATLTIPSEVTRINDFALVGYNSPQYIIATSVTYIGRYAFKDCKNLVRVDLAENVTVDETAFSGSPFTYVKP